MSKIAIIDTARGVMKAQLYSEDAPGTVANFEKLSNNQFYDDLTFHRVIPGFVTQGGCPDGNGAGGPGYSIPCELLGKQQTHDKGVLSMAHAGRDTGGSQFFICHSREKTQHLDRRHTCFGKIYEGLEIIELLQAGDRINSIRVIEEE
jgi:peptidyl-prolyl cis-trans isomerase B (cyclophilin B)